MGSDGARITTTIDQNDGGVYAVSPANQWVKNGSVYQQIYSASASSCGYVGPVKECTCKRYKDCNDLISECTGKKDVWICGKMDSEMKCVEGTCQTG